MFFIGNVSFSQVFFGFPAEIIVFLWFSYVFHRKCQFFICFLLFFIENHSFPLIFLCFSQKSMFSYCFLWFWVFQARLPELGQLGLGLAGWAGLGRAWLAGLGSPGLRWLGQARLPGWAGWAGWAGLGCALRAPPGLSWGPLGSHGLCGCDPGALRPCSLLNMY